MHGARLCSCYATLQWRIIATQSDETLYKVHSSRNRPPVGYDSVLTGDRNVDHVGIYSHQRHNELQYLIFDSTQVRSRLFYIIARSKRIKVQNKSISFPFFQAIPLYLLCFNI